ncbi:MBL fold metallo-hydrolase [Roseivirga spongicola]|uniref:Pyrroloquinoline quinone biosynthesis protein PqqB n=1 Tax=Roseivirga spongicola TaxID=333140 RepID=A0A150XBR3_9BACT|nr:MBL fold metallo-hydrolase [Roseivirga spongicola]KYG76148.1 pyrroloquinoline quinone biosynthesis protein PqqB [Roseivirga spongicola]WPZ10856.1 MBL fold metallo-hydrolase [Roseivirga spongicola]
MALFLFIFLGCSEVSQVENTAPKTPFIMVLGVAQDAGYPQAGYQEEWKAINLGQRKPLYTVSLGLIDPINKKRYLFDATPDFKEQLQMLDEISETNDYPLDGIFLTHAHIGHYTGLMHLGREVMGTAGVPVHAMPKMKTFLEENGPWNQLVSLNNISIKPMQDSTLVELSKDISVMPFTVPHRDEYSETVGFKIQINQKSVVFIPDIDKWNKWDVDIREVVKNNDIILIDASFYQDGELEGRDMSLIPHPFTKESMELFSELSKTDKAKVHFIHANHTNPILDMNSPEYEEVSQAGFNVAQQGQIFGFQEK